MQLDRRDGGGAFEGRCDRADRISSITSIVRAALLQSR